MNAIQFECPHCHAIIAGDESLYGQRVNCQKCQAEMLVPQAPAKSGLQTARLVQEPVAAGAVTSDAVSQETEIFNLSPVARAFAGQILLGVVLIGLAGGFALRAPVWSWPRWPALIPFTLGVLLLLRVWIRVKAYRYRLTTQRLFVRRGWLTKHEDELELYRVKDVRVDQGFLQRVLRYGTVTVLADDDTTPEVDLVSVSRPTQVKEMLRTQYRAARQREGVRPTEFLQSP